jgi:ubiquitin carboxyl-terminal hydrolase 14
LDNVLGEKFIENFQIGFKSSIRNLEDLTDFEEKYENDLKLQCHIDIKTNFLKNGLENSLTDHLQKFSQTLNKDCDYEITKRITKLPTVLTIQFVRFFWKRTTNKKSKILRKVQFPFQLDLADLLDDDYKPEKIKVRDQLRSLEKEKITEITEYNKSHISTNAQREFAEAKYNEYLAKYRSIYPEDLSNGENASSLYELNGVLTHQGSSADSGHYQAFIKDKFDDNKWWRFNDDKVSVVDKAKIESLSGGGESDSALILLYKGFGLE